MKKRIEIEQQIIEKAAEDKDFLKLLKQNPKQTIVEFLPDDVKIPEDVSIKVMQETPSELILRLPFTLSDKEELSEDELDAIAGGQSYGDAIKFVHRTNVDVAKSIINHQNVFDAATGGCKR